MGLEGAGWRHAALIERDRHACATIRLNHRRAVGPAKNWRLIQGDVRNIKYSSEFAQVSMVAGGPPCQPLGKRCGVELNLRQLVDAVHKEHSNSMEPYINRFHEDVCVHCENRTTDQCPCALEYLLELAVEAIETVDERRCSTESSA